MRVYLKNARAAFLTIWTPEPFPGSKDTTPYYSLTALIAPDHPQVAEIRKGIEAAAAEKLGTNWKATLAAAERLGKVCMRDGDLKPDYEGFPGNLAITMRSKVRPTILNRDKSPLVEADGVLYSGCYIDVQFDLFGYTNTSKGVGAGLKGLMYRGPGDAFSGSAPANPDDFEALGDTGEDDLAG